MTADLLAHHIRRLYTMDRGEGRLGLIEDASVAFTGGAVSYIGPAADAPAAHETIDASGLVGLPGLIDCHTHTVWAGSRADEWQRRLAGTPYTDILEEGGGILSTVRHTRAASTEQLAALARQRLVGMRARGVTTVEIKSGYGLSPEHEVRMLTAARRCNDTVRVLTTFLGAHAVPAEWRPDRAGYIRHVIEEQLPRCAPLADAIDVYCDRGAFTLAEAEAILRAGQALGLALHIHAEQIAYTGAAEMAAGLGAASADHLERLDARGAAAMAAAGTVAVMLPGAQLYLRDTSPPVDMLREAGVRMAVATDLNPGTSPIADLWSCATLACILQGLTVEEAALGITRHAAAALGRDDLGWLGAGSAADLILVAPPPGEAPDLAGLIQHMGGGQVRAVIQDGARTV
jgi:imidazolonepropionase